MVKILLWPLLLVGFALQAMASDVVVILSEANALALNVVVHEELVTAQNPSSAEAFAKTFAAKVTSKTNQKR